MQAGKVLLTTRSHSAMSSGVSLRNMVSARPKIRCTVEAGALGAGTAGQNPRQGCASPSPAAKGWKMPNAER